MSQLQRLVSLEWCFMRQKDVHEVRAFTTHLQSSKFQGSCQVQREAHWYFCLKCPTYEATQQCVRVAFFPLIFKKSDTLLFSVNLFHPGSNFCFPFFCFLSFFFFSSWKQLTLYTSGKWATRILFRIRNIAITLNHQVADSYAGIHSSRVQKHQNLDAKRTVNHVSSLRFVSWFMILKIIGSPIIIGSPSSSL